MLANVSVIKAPPPHNLATKVRSNLRTSGRRQPDLHQDTAEAENLCLHTLY
jgi:hypothetical protein